MCIRDRVGLLALNAESSVGSGIRRVEAFVGMEAFQHLAKERSLVMGLADTLKVQPDQVSDRVARMIAQLKDAEREIAALKSQNLLAGLDAIVATSKDMWGIGYIAHRADGVGGNDLRNLVQEVRAKVANTASVICVIGGTAEKPAVVVATTCLLYTSPSPRD